MEHEQESKADVESPPARINESVSEDSTLDEKRERLLIRKIDYHILPLVVLLYLFSFLDRGMLWFSPCLSHQCTDSWASQHRECSTVWIGRGPGPGRKSIPGCGVYSLRYILCTI
jgi:hypothetical protein